MPVLPARASRKTGGSSETYETGFALDWVVGAQGLEPWTR
jgi:hypothetical protein